MTAGEPIRPGSRPEDLAPPGRLLLAALIEFGPALALAGTAVSETQERLVRIATANGAPARGLWCCRPR